MPIEIKELIIKATVVSEGEGPATGTSSTTTSAESKVNEEKLIARCVEQVMEILRVRSER